MKLTFIGGGAFRILADIRALLKTNGLQPGDEISLYDISLERAETMAALIRQAPENKAGIKVRICTSLDRSLEGSDFVYFVIRPWRDEVFTTADQECLKSGFIASDNLSLPGALLAAVGVPVAVDLAHRMEKLCPTAWLIIFTNPIPILTYAVCKATRIRAVGICAGYTNHHADLPRIMGWPFPDTDFEVDVAGINHMSWILRCKYKGQDFFSLLDKRIVAGIDYERLRSDPINEWLIWLLPKMVEMYQRYHVILFSSEGDGFPNLGYYDETVGKMRNSPPFDMASFLKQRQVVFQEVAKAASHGIPEEMWQERGGLLEKSGLALNGMESIERSVGARLIYGLAGRSPKPLQLVASVPANGAIVDFPAEAVMEYSLIAEDRKLIRKNTYSIPAGISGLTRALVEHQMLIAESILSKDKNLFFKGMFSYPLLRSFQKGDTLIRRMIESAKSELPDFFS